MWLRYFLVALKTFLIFTIWLASGLSRQVSRDSCLSAWDILLPWMTDQAFLKAFTLYQWHSTLKPKDAIREYVNSQAMYRWIISWLTCLFSFFCFLFLWFLLWLLAFWFIFLFHISFLTFLLFFFLFFLFLFFFLFLGLNYFFDSHNTTEESQKQ